MKKQKEIMKEIRNKVRKKTGLLPGYKSDIEKINNLKLQKLDSTHSDIEFLEKNYNIYQLGTHKCRRKIIGKLVNGIRQRIQIEVEHAIAPIINKQNAFNICNVKLLKKLNEEAGNVREKLKPPPEPDVREFLEIEAVSNQEKLKKTLRELPVKKLNKRDIEFHLFEKIFYDSKTVTQKQRIYIKYVNKNLSKEFDFLDVGCGRGEFLQLLTKNSIKCIGIDKNSAQVATAKNKGLNVLSIDLLKYLKNTKKKFSGISALQTIEHLTAENMRQFFSLAYDKIVNRGTIIIETINPYCNLAMYSFYMDSTHEKPLPNELLVFILELVGFRKIKVVYNNPVPPSYRSPEVIRNYHDYAVIGYK